MSTVTPDDIAVALGRTAPAVESAEYAQWSMWIGDAEMLIETRRVQVDDTLELDEVKVDYVVRQAVLAHVLRPDNATQVTISVDDASTSKTYRSSTGRVSILDEWWALLGLAVVAGSVFTIDTAATSLGHAPYCDLMFDPTASCSCGASIGMFPTRYDTWA